MGRLRGSGLGLLAACFLFVMAPGAEEQTAPAAGEEEMEMPMVALTFDDGPRRSTTTQLLDGLAQRKVPATFFVVGSRVKGNEALLQRMAREGHQIGVHTYSHTQLTGLSSAQVACEIQKGRQALTQALGPGDYWLRPPFGLVNSCVKACADSPIILWSVDPEDWKDKNTARIVDHVVSNAKDGDIILLHDMYPSSVQAALEIVDRLGERGFCFVTVEQLMACQEIAPEAGVIFP